MSQRRFHAWLNPFERLVDGLCDPARRDRLAGALIAGFVAVYTVYGTLASWNSDVHRDFGELIAWSHAPALGYNHPPLSAWVATVWFGVFPRADWSAYLLGMSTSGLALWISWKLFGDWLDARKRVVALAMLTLVPLYTFHALKFNANTVTMPFWAAASLYFLRSFLRRGATQAAFAGIAAGLAMLGKYWSVFLLAGLGLAALFDPRRARYFRSAAPWISIAAGLIVLAPHLVWLISGRASTLAFAASTLPGGDDRIRSLGYLGGSLAYVAVPLIIFLALRPGRAGIADALRPPDADRRLVAVLFWASLLLPAIANLIVPVRLTALWTIPNWTLLPVILLGPAAIAVSRGFAAKVMAAAIVVPLLALIASPMIAAVKQSQAPTGSHAHERALTQAAEALWREQTARPLRLAGGDGELVYGIAFYATDRIVAIADPLAAAAAQRIDRDGIVLACTGDDKSCLSVIDAVSRRHGGRREEIELRRDYWGIPGVPARYVLFAAPPKSN